MVTQQAYGTWRSPISSRMLSGNMKLYDVQWDSNGETLVWLERRATGGTLVMQRGTDATRDITDSSFRVRGGVLYGGGEFTLHDGTCYFVASGRIHKVSLDSGIPRPITPKFGGMAAPTVSPDGKWIVFVHTYEGQDVLAIVDSEGHYYPQKLAQGHDFYMQPAWSPDGTQLAYVAWNHPNMPWLGTELRVLTIGYRDGLPHAVAERYIAGGLDVYVFQPQFSPDGHYLAYISDETGFGQIYLHDLKTLEHQQLTDTQHEHSMPAWVQGLRTYGWTQDSKALYFLRHFQGVYDLCLYDIEYNTALEIHELGEYGYMDRMHVMGEQVAMIASSGTIAPRIISYNREDGVRVRRRATNEAIANDYLSVAEPIQWQSNDGATVYGFLSMPTNPNYSSEGLPPLIVDVHSGPTRHRSDEFQEEIQFFTSRGFAVLQVNYRGSTGHGREYMLAHGGNYGVTDVDDCVSGAQHLVDEGLVHPEQLVIMGGSAGGFTVWQTLIDHPNVFKAAIVSYGVANQFTLVQDTHKFEQHFNDWLLGTLPEAANVYHERSPQFHAHKIKDAVLVFHGAKDTVVPKSQADAMVAGLRRNGVSHEYVVYENEGHSFSQPETLDDYYRKVLDFLLQHVIYA